MYAIMKRSTIQAEELEKLQKEHNRMVKMPLVLKGEFQDPSLVEKNDLAIAEESLLKEKQVEKKHLKLIVENVLVEVEDFKFPINSLTFWHGRELTSFKFRKTFLCHKLSVD